jgi:hypothetical protein
VSQLAHELLAASRLSRLREKAGEQRHTVPEPGGHFVGLFGGRHHSRERLRLQVCLDQDETGGTVAGIHVDCLLHFRDRLVTHACVHEMTRRHSAPRHVQRILLHRQPHLGN